MSKDAIERLFQNSAIECLGSLRDAEKARLHAFLYSSPKTQPTNFPYYHPSARSFAPRSQHVEVWTDVTRGTSGDGTRSTSDDKTVRVSGRRVGRMMIVDEIEVEEGATKKS